MLDDELDDLDEKDLLHDEEDELLNPSPESDKKKVEKAGKPASSSKEEKAPAKKVSLKRNLQIQTPVLESVEEKTEIVAERKSSDADAVEPPKKLIKIAEMSVAERRKIRLEKFGNTVPTVDLVAVDEKKAARAARFGITETVSAGTNNSSSFSAASIKSGGTEADLEKLQKRAERFGATTSTKLNAVEMQEKLKKRQERFGAAAATTTTTITPAASDDKLQKRLERFKVAA